MTSDAMASKLSKSPLTPSEAWTFYTAIYRPKIFYPAKVTTFSKAEWTSVTRKFTFSIIQKMGFNGHTDRRVVFGPRRLGGIGMVPGYALQGAEGLRPFHVPCAR